jgi:hypothetical protein
MHVSHISIQSNFKLGLPANNCLENPPARTPISAPMVNFNSLNTTELAIIFLPQIDSHSYPGAPSDD